MKHVLVTGASGFIGRAVVETLATDGHKVRAAVRAPPVPNLPRGVEIVQHEDLLGPINWSPLVHHIDTVIHLAGVAHVGRGANAEIHDRVNRQATADLALAAAHAGLKRFIFVSSVRAQSGPAADHVLTERDPPMPTDAYGRSKLAAELDVRAAGTPFVILRPVPLYGPGAKGNVAALLRLSKSPLPLPVKNFTNRRSLLGIDNFVSALRFVISSPAAIGETYLVADPGAALTVYDMVSTVRQTLHLPHLLMPGAPRLVEKVLRMTGRNDIWQRLGCDLQVDPGKLIRAGWQPLHDTRAGLTALFGAPV